MINLFYIVGAVFMFLSGLGFGGGHNEDRSISMWLLFVGLVNISLGLFL